MNPNELYYKTLQLQYPETTNQDVNNIRQKYLCFVENIEECLDRDIGVMAKSYLIQAIFNYEDMLSQLYYKANINQEGEKK